MKFATCSSNRKMTINYFSEEESKLLLFTDSLISRYVKNLHKIDFYTLYSAYKSFREDPGLQNKVARQMEKINNNANEEIKVILFEVHNFVFKTFMHNSLFFMLIFRVPKMFNLIDGSIKKFISLPKHAVEKIF